MTEFSHTKCKLDKVQSCSRINQILSIFIHLNNDELQVERFHPLSLSPIVLRCLDDVPREALQVRSAASPGSGVQGGWPAVPQAGLSGWSLRLEPVWELVEACWSLLSLPESAELAGACQSLLSLPESSELAGAC